MGVCWTVLLVWWNCISDSQDRQTTVDVILQPPLAFTHKRAHTHTHIPREKWSILNTGTDPRTVQQTGQRRNVASPTHPLWAELTSTEGTYYVTQRYPYTTSSLQPGINETGARQALVRGVARAGLRVHPPGITISCIPSSSREGGRTGGTLSILKTALHP